MMNKCWKVLFLMCVVATLLCGCSFFGSRINTDEVIGDWYRTAEVDYESVDAILSLM